MHAHQEKIGTLGKRGNERKEDEIRIIHRFLTTTYSRPLKFPNLKNIRGFFIAEK